MGAALSLMGYEPWPLPDAIPSWNNQSRVINKFPGARTSYLNLTDDLPEHSDPNVTTIYENFLRGQKVLTMTMMNMVMVTIQGGQTEHTTPIYGWGKSAPWLGGKSAPNRC